MCKITIFACAVCLKTSTIDTDHCRPVRRLLSGGIDQPARHHIQQAFIWSPLEGCQGLLIMPEIEMTRCTAHPEDEEESSNTAASTNSCSSSRSGRTGSELSTTSRLNLPPLWSLVRTTISRVMGRRETETETSHRRQAGRSVGTHRIGESGMVIRLTVSQLTLEEHLECLDK